MRRPNIRLIGAIVLIIGIIIAIDYGIARANVPAPVGVGFLPAPTTFAVTPRDVPGQFFPGPNGAAYFYEKAQAPSHQPVA